MSNSFDFITTPINDLYEIERKQIGDQRGFFSRLFCSTEFKEIGLTKPFLQVNHTMTQKKRTVRGMHFQYPPHMESKVVSCIKGEVFDVAVDIRRDSKTFLHWHSAVLSAKNLRSFYIPEGFAHGFQALTEDCQLLYHHSESYTPSSEGIINPLDLMLGINWPFEIGEISQRDGSQPMLDNSFKGLDVL